MSQTAIGYGAVFYCATFVSEPKNAAQKDCLYGGTATGLCTQCSYSGGSQAEVWEYDAATQSGPVMDCSSTWSGSGCVWSQNGAIVYCYRDYEPSTGAWLSNPTTEAIRPATVADWLSG